MFVQAAPQGRMLLYTNDIIISGSDRAGIDCMKSYSEAIQVK